MTSAGSWGTSTFGDPCRECGYLWSTSTASAISLVQAFPTRCSKLLGDSNGSERHPELSWSVTAYVCHVGDNLRIWAERLASLEDAALPVVPYDANLLAEARSYDTFSVSGALWSLARSVESWLAAVDPSLDGTGSILHPDRGELTVADVVSTNAHDTHHHGWDIERSLSADWARPTERREPR